MNLDNLNLVELNAQEVQEVDGGCPVCIWQVYGPHVCDFLAGFLGI
jgi:hypothetical protein